MSGAFGKLNKLGLWIGAVAAAMIIINYTFRAFAPHVQDNPAAQGAASILH